MLSEHRSVDNLWIIGRYCRRGIKLSLQEKHATHIIEVTMNQHHRSKRSLIGERNHFAENPGFLNG
jgi:hypothetical protein